MKLFGIMKKLIGKTKNGENLPSPEVDEVDLVQFNFVDNHFMPNKSYAYLLKC